MGYLKGVKLLLALFIIVSSAAIQAQDTTTIWGKIAGAIGGGIGNIMNNVSRVNIEGSRLGFDEGIVANVIAGVGRNVERNQRPTGAHDRYLVKDSLTIGFRFGGGLVVMGEASYIVKYTLVYPAETQSKGMYNNHFIFDIALPFKVWRNKLPKQYVLMTESWIEGSGRIKLGGNVLIPIGSSTKYGRVHMNRTMISNKSGRKIMVFKDQAKFNRLSEELYLSLILLDIPMLEARRDEGHLTRTYIEMNVSESECLEQCYKALDQVVKRNKTGLLEKLGKKRRLETDFIERYQYQTLLWLLSSEAHIRVDDVTEYSTDQNGNETQSRSFQIDARRFSNWTIGFDGEDYKTKLLLSAGPEETEKGIAFKDPIMSLTLLTRDYSLKDDEYENDYQPMMGKILDDPAFMKGGMGAINENIMSPQAVGRMSMTFYPEGVKRIMETKENQFWNTLATVFGKKASYLKMASRRDYNDKYQRKMRNNRIPLPTMYLAKRAWAVIRYLDEARKKKQPLEQLEKFAMGMRHAVYVSSATNFRPELIAVLIKLAGKENVYVESDFIRFVKDKYLNKHPDQVISSSMGTKREMDVRTHQFLFLDPNEIYHLF